MRWPTIRGRLWPASSSAAAIHLERVFLLGAAALSSPSCVTEPRPAVAVARILPPYDAHQAELFDDAIEPAVVGLARELAAASPTDPLLRERALRADVVLRARVITVTSDNGSATPSWRIGLHRLETLVGAAPSDDLTLEVSPKSLAAGIVHAYEGRLIGVTTTAFVRSFGAAGEFAETHFHLAPDDASLVDVVRSSAVLTQGAHGT